MAAYSWLARQSQAKFHTMKLSPLVGPNDRTPPEDWTFGRLQTGSAVVSQDRQASREENYHCDLFAGPAASSWRPCSSDGSSAGDGRPGRCRLAHSWRPGHSGRPGHSWWPGQWRPGQWRPGRRRSGQWRPGGRPGHSWFIWQLSSSVWWPGGVNMSSDGGNGRFGRPWNPRQEPHQRVDQTPPYWQGPAVCFSHQYRPPSTRQRWSTLCLCGYYYSVGWTRVWFQIPRPARLYSRQCLLPYMTQHPGDQTRRLELQRDVPGLLSPGLHRDHPGRLSDGSGCPWDKPGVTGTPENQDHVLHSLDRHQ